MAIALAAVARVVTVGVGGKPPWPGLGTQGVSSPPHCAKATCDTPHISINPSASSPKEPRNGTGQRTLGFVGMIVLRMLELSERIQSSIDCHLYLFMTYI